MKLLSEKLEKASNEWVKHRISSGPAEYAYKIASAEQMLKARAALVNQGIDRPNVEELKAHVLLQCRSEYEDYCIAQAYYDAAKERCKHLIAEITVEQSKLQGQKIEAQLSGHQ